MIRVLYTNNSDSGHYLLEHDEEEKSVVVSRWKGDSCWSNPGSEVAVFYTDTVELELRDKTFDLSTIEVLGILRDYLSTEMTNYTDKYIPYKQA